MAGPSATGAGPRPPARSRPARSRSARSRSARSRPAIPRPARPRRQIPASETPARQIPVGQIPASEIPDNEIPDHRCGGLGGARAAAQGAEAGPEPGADRGRRRAGRRHRGPRRGIHGPGGAELDTAPMSLYRHVSDKKELLRLMVDAAWGDSPRPLAAGRTGGTGWPDGPGDAGVARRHPWRCASRSAGCRSCRARSPGSRTRWPACTAPA